MPECFTFTTVSTALSLLHQNQFLSSLLKKHSDIWHCQRLPQLFDHFFYHHKLLQMCDAHICTLGQRKKISTLALTFVYITTEAGRHRHRHRSTTKKKKARCQTTRESSKNSGSGGGGGGNGYTRQLAWKMKVAQLLLHLQLQPQRCTRISEKVSEARGQQWS